MARVLGLEEIHLSLKGALLSALRVCDEATVLPQAYRSEESGAFKNVVMRLNGAEPELVSDLFSPDWFGGVSVVHIPNEVAEPLIQNAERRQKALKKLVDAIPSELSDSQLTTGPELKCDESDRDLKGWTAGFDSSACCVGLYSAQELRAPEAGKDGMNRAHLAFYLVCKAGGGVASQTFHSRLQSALRKGISLDHALESGSEPGPQSLRRVSLASRRNRQRLLLMAAEALGIDQVLDTISDNASWAEEPHRMVIPTLDVTFNSIRKEEGAGGRSSWLYASGCVDAAMSQGLLTSSNVSEGFVAFTDAQGSFKINVRNDAQNAIPFATRRMKTSREMATLIAKEHIVAKSKKVTEEAHPDHEWVHERFGWKDAQKIDMKDNKLEPPALWGSHASESFLASWSRELGVATLKPVRLSPEIVCISGMEQAKLRAALKHVVSHTS